MSSIYEPSYRIFATCIKDYRLRAKMTQEALALQLGCAQSYVSKYEQGQKRLDIVEIRNICKILGVSLSEFVSEYEFRLKKAGL